MLAFGGEGVLVIVERGLNAEGSLRLQRGAEVAAVEMHALQDFVGLVRYAIYFRVCDEEAGLVEREQLGALAVEIEGDGAFHGIQNLN